MWSYPEGIDDNIPDFIIQGIEEWHYQDCRKEKDFTSRQYEAIREYYHRYNGLEAYNGEYGWPDPSDMLEVVLSERFGVLPNVREIRFARTLIKHMPFYSEHRRFWENNDFNGWVNQLSELRMNEHFPDRSGLVKHIITSLSVTCKSLELRCSYGRVASGQF